MSQNDLVIANQSFPSFRTDLNSALQAIYTSHSGTSLPSGASAGTIWLDTTSATTPTLKYYDGTDNISLATIDHVGNTVNWLDSTVSITGLSTTATATVLTLTDSASTSTVNLIIDNQKEVRFRETTANGTNYVAFKAPASLSADLTFTLPTAHGTAGQFLSTNGSGGVLSFASVSGGIEWQAVHSSATLTAVAGYGYFLNTTSNAITVTLPASPSAGQQVQLVDYAGTFDTNNLTINPNSNKLEGGTSNLILSGDREGVILTYIDATQGWLATSGINEGTDALSLPPYSIDFLVVAGGGGGGGQQGGGGGGAGGYRTSTQSISIGTVITATVGDGGVGTSAATANSGSNSSISGSGLTTITSNGGGGGGRGEGPNSTEGGNGGSGGGGGGQTGSQTFVGGSGNTPSTSPSQGNNGGGNTTSANYGAGGGGGANAVGANGTGSNSGNGGNGTASSITGSSVTYAGGGGGAQTTSGATLGSGGTGGGGAGTSSTGTNGTANTGGGAGGGAGMSNGGNGGKGVVILSVPTASYSGTSTGSPTITTSGANTILQFNGSGSYTA